MTVTTGTLRVGILAILAGLIGAYVIQQVLTSKPEPVKAAPIVQTIPQAAAELPEGRVVTLGDIVLVPMTQTQLQKTGVDATTVMVDPSQIIGRRLRQPLSQGELFTTTKMFLEFSGPDLSQKLKPGYRAFSISSHDQTTNYQPGMVVDVLFRTNPRPARDGFQAIPEMTVTLLQSLEIVHVELPPPPKPTDNRRSLMLDLSQRSGSQSARPPKVITLAVTPEQAKILKTAMGRGEISLSPWSAQDRVAIPESAKEGLTLEKILGIEPPPPAPAPIPPFITEVYRRGQADVRGYSRDAIHTWQSPKPVKPASLPAPKGAETPAPAAQDEPQE